MTCVSRLTYLDAPVPLALAHRGGAGTGSNVGIENTRESFADAVARGFAYLETDVRCSADGTVWTLHDETLERVAGDGAAVAELTDTQIAARRLDGRAAPARLVDVLRDFPDTRLNIDIKAEDAVEATCDLVRAEGAIGRVCLASFSYRRVRRVRRLLPGVATGASSLEVALVKLLPAVVLRVLRLPRADCLQVPVSNGGLTVVTDRFIRRAHGLGLQVHVWTVDETDEMNRLLDLGVDGLITDRTDLLADVLAARGTPLSGRDTS